MELIFSWLSWLAVCTNDSDSDGVVQHGGHTLGNRLRDMQPRFKVHLFDIAHPCYDQLTPIKQGLC